ncbi:hypothetical protein [Magnetospirillum gryphiswaldense]|uniref:Uncharacterized protein n=2 Tax=Magnetospirillum gryphiswaldense TaxID=55518 RepID=V6EWP8_MAGGM|nr:hypothetical protein [Magnetospirillum gryphiswaldense]AVM74224.1 hypothetical protein MSR1_17320 [Magnetospirillum gryphiswaldense MSR-1]AVM78127.1 hypothetical protein MSR1L_17320 [Magnetospirillum gryphiswaldense]CAM76451.1 Intein/homing endonuclease [Magnetospirillum gryphiswaldense MSR-1]CDK97695.1 protein of unknown function [Magnetospirillum gryphiswaldense MSR-1 v2]
MRNHACAIAAILTGMSAFSAFAADPAPAVSAPNVKVDVMGGALSGGPAILGGATFTAPLGHDFGVQMDGAFGMADQDLRGGMAVHLFYRDPTSMLLGVTGMWSNIAGPHKDAKSNIRRVGAEAEFYFDDFSILPSAGVQNDHADTTGYANLGGIYYATPNLALGTSVSGVANSRAIQAGFEYRPDSWTNTSYLFDTGVGNQGAAFVLAGIRFSFGAPSKTLQQRDRYDDPGNIVTYMNTVGSAAVTTKTDHIPTPTAVAVAPPT